ncbi:MAG: hypothetical protein JO352_00305 [Chloroflexi bacterium]|nr:hypothetical protein [Chloroflexota bacterium]MBV9597585.1 hypothetical protein [Chloroflexota bacterium]
MHGFVIEELPCPNCRNLRTVRFGTTSFCFNCRTQRDESALSYPFSDAQLARLRVYRAAVRNHFYSDQLTG